MLKRFGVAMLAVLFIVFGLSFQSASAISPNIVISQLKAGNVSTSRLAEIYNNSHDDIDVTGWCLYYGSPGSHDPQTELGCFSDADNSVHIFLPGQSFALLVSSQVGIPSDLILAQGMGNGTSGHAYLLDAEHVEIDRVGWGSLPGTVNAEGGQPIALDSTKVIERKRSTVPEVLIDTDNNLSDFVNSTLRTKYYYGALYEVVDLCQNIIGIQETIPDDYSIDANGNCLPPPVDMCTNIDGLQVAVPPGYALDGDNLCQPDACINITGLQLAIPPGKELDLAGNCVDHDYCINLPGIQIALPVGYLVNSLGNCLLDLPIIKVNELLANAFGSDIGNEFIEIYNPGSASVDLSFYMLRVGVDKQKLYAFPPGNIIAPGGYATFSDDDIAFTLVNTVSQVSIVSTDDQLIDESPSYSNAGEGMAWALIGGVWQYTNQPTPGSDNLPSIVDVDNDEEIVVGLKPCALNQYRNPETNRCRLLVTAGSTLVACKDGQYRSEITNRCRSIADDATSLSPCNDNQERNPETNRCRLIANNNTGLAACKEGQERNIDTNRCRNVAGGVPDAAFAVEPIVDSGNGLVGLWALGGILTLALAYAGWEWRAEFLQLIKKFGSFFHLQK